MVTWLVKATAVSFSPSFLPATLASDSNWGSGTGSGAGYKRKKGVDKELKGANKLAKAAKKYRNKKPVFKQAVNRESSNQTPTSTTFKPVSGSQSKTISSSTSSYNANAYVKKDIKWTMITTSIIVVILIIVYIFLG